MERVSEKAYKTISEYDYTQKYEKMLTTSSSFNYNTTNDELTVLTDSVMKFEKIAISFGSFLLFIFTLSIALVCVKKCRKQKRRLKRMIRGRRSPPNPNQNPIYTGTTIPMSPISDQPVPQITSVVNMNYMPNAPRNAPRPSISKPVLQSTSVKNMTYMPRDLYEKEQEVR